MTVEEAIKFAHYAPQLSKEPEVREFYRMCERSLRAQQAAAKLDRGRWEGCCTCNNTPGIMLGEITMCIGKRILTTESHEFKFCPECGKPLTEEAWAEMERRIGGKRWND